MADDAIELRSCLRVRCEPGWSLGPDWSERLGDDDIWMVWDGLGEMVINGQETVPIRPGVCFWLRPGGQYLATQDPRHRLGVTSVHFLNGRSADRPTPPLWQWIPDVAYAETTLSRIARLAMAEPRDPARSGLAAGLLAGFLEDYRAGFPEPEGRVVDDPEAPRLAALLADIAADPGGDWSRAAMADRLDVPEHAVGRLFRRGAGVSPRRYVIEQRIRRARHLLATSAMTLEQIADGLGYRDVYYFNRQFHQQVGTRPGRFRREARQRRPGR
ncbi:MAG: AraC family transcriptional regulator [Planctomycetota bacterium]